jgi:hypothetical protein
MLQFKIGLTNSSIRISLRAKMNKGFRKAVLSPKIIFFPLAYLVIKKSRFQKSITA